MQNQAGKRTTFFKIIGILFFIVTIVIIYLGNDAVVFMMDDNWYSTRLYDEQPLQNIGDIIAAQSWHFYNWGGRCIAHGILQLTLMSGEFCADLMNVIFNILLSLLSNSLILLNSNTINANTIVIIIP